MALYPQIKSIGSTGSMILAILEVQVCIECKATCSLLSTALQNDPKPISQACIMGPHAESETQENSDMIKGMTYAPRLGTIPEGPCTPT